MLTHNEVIDTFEIVLGREPEDVTAVEFHAEFSSRAELSEHLFATPEFRDRLTPILYANAKPRWVMAEINGGLRLWLDLNDVGVSVPCLNEAYEPAETAFVLSQLKPGDLFIDVGANIGWFTVLAAWAVGSSGYVAAFEPMLETYRYLERSVRENDFASRCQLFPVALGAKAGTATIAVHPKEHNRGHAHLVTSRPEETDSDGPVLHSEVSVRCLDDIKLPRRVSMIKIDVEGAEGLVVVGGSNTIERDKPIVLAELFPSWLQKVSGIKAEEFIDQMSELGYKPFSLNPSGRCEPYELPPEYLLMDNYYTTPIFLTNQQFHQLI